MEILVERTTGDLLLTAAALVRRVMRVGDGGELVNPVGDEESVFVHHRYHCLTCVMSHATQRTRNLTMRDSRSAAHSCPQIDSLELQGFLKSHSDHKRDSWQILILNNNMT